MISNQLMNNNQKTYVRLSPSAVEALERCPRCFWLHYNRGIDQPEGIVSRLANRFDAVLKNYFNIYRQINEMPPMIKGKVEGKLENPFQEIYFYNHNEKYDFYGKLDECLVTDDGKYTPIDFKTSSSDPRKKEIFPAYQNQMDAYAFLLEANNKKTTGLSQLIYFYPDQGRGLHNGFPMVVHIVTVKTNPQSAKNKFLNAIEVLEKDIPQSSLNCPFCRWYDRVGAELGKK